MPSPTQNFTTPEWEEEGGIPQQGGRYDSQGDYIEDPSYHPRTMPVQTFDRFGWGGRGNDIDPVTGEEVRGTSGLARDVNRFQGMGSKPVYASGPEINQGLANDARGVTLGGLGLMGARAMGRSPSVAEQAGTAQAQAGAAGLRSMGATMRGPAFARVAASRLARRQGAGVMQRQVGTNLATRAGEMADAREGLVGATGAMRQQDIGVAKDQAALDVGQRQQNDQREGFYEDLAHDTQTAQVGARLGRSASEQAANSAANQQQRAAEAQREQNTRDNISTGVSAGSGVVQGYIKSHPTTGSEEQTKVNVKPLDRMKKRSRDIIREYPTDGFGPTDEMLDDRARQNGVTPDWLAKAGGREIQREDPYSSPRFGKRYKPGPDTISTKFTDDGDLAPGTADAEHGEGKKLDEWSRLISLSPGEAKEDIKPLSEDEKRSMPWYRGPNPTEQRPAMPKTEADARARGQRTPAMQAESKAKSDANISILDRIVGFVAGQGGEGIIREGRAHDAERRARETTLSPGEAKEDIVDLDAYGRDGYDVGEGPGERDFDADEHVESNFPKPYERPEGQTARQDTGAEMSRVLTPMADQQIAGMRANLGRGPSTNRITDLQAEALRQKADEMMGEFKAGKRPTLSERQDPYNEAPDLSDAARAHEKRAHEGNPMDGALRALKPYEYEYKDGFREAEGQEPGEKNVGPMADEMDEDEVARTALTRDPRTGLRAIDLKKGLKLALGGLGHVQRKLDALQSRRTA